MPQPALEQDHVAGLCRVGRVQAIFLAPVGRFRRGGHKRGQPRVLEFQARATDRGDDVVGAADKAVRVKVHRVRSVFGHDIYPAIGHMDIAPAQIEIERLGECAHVFAELLF